MVTLAMWFWPLVLVFNQSLSDFGTGVELVLHTSVIPVQFSTLATQETQSENSNNKETDMRIFLIALEQEGHVFRAEPVALNAVFTLLHAVMVLCALKNPKMKKHKTKKNHKTPSNKRMLIGSKVKKCDLMQIYK